MASYTPWNYRAEAIGAPQELANFRGAFLPFAKTREQRESNGDTRLSVEERYASQDEYLGRYAKAAMTLIEQRYLLAEDLPDLLKEAERLWEAVAEPVDMRKAVGE